MLPVPEDSWLRLSGVASLTGLCGHRHLIYLSASVGSGTSTIQLLHLHTFNLESAYISTTAFYTAATHIYHRPPQPQPPPPPPQQLHPLPVNISQTLYNMLVAVSDMSTYRNDPQPRDGSAANSRFESDSSMLLCMAGDEPQPRCGG